MSEDLPKTRKEAKDVGATYYYTGKPCKYGHDSVRRSINGSCYECHKASSLKWQQSNVEYKKNYKKAYYDKHIEYIREYQKRWRKNNCEHIRDYDKKWYKKNRQYKLDYYKLNKTRYRSYVANRRAQKLNATLPGHREEIALFYASCPEGFHVDHIVPLQGDVVCGLHVPWNLQYLTAEENLRKNNKFDPSLLETGFTAPHI